MQAAAAYAELMRRVREESLLASCAALLGWDEETYLPPAGVAHRASQLALLAGLEHERATDPRRGELLNELQGSDLTDDPHSPAGANLRELRRAYDRAGRLPRSLVEELTRTASFAQQAWLEAYQAADFSRFRPWLERILVLKRRQAECLADGVCSYDVLLDEYEPGARSADVVRLFDQLRAELVPLAGALTHAGRRPLPTVLRQPFPLEGQRALSEQAAAAVGFDFRRGRLDCTAHPFFATVGPGDCRITTRYRRQGLNGFFATLHEVGHGLYEQGLDPQHFGTAAGEAASLGLHESQARLWENTVGRGLPFWRHFYSAARRLFPGQLGDVRLEDFHFAVNAVEPTPLRVGADEVTYNLHIVLRFDLERALLAGDLAATDLRAAWAEAYRHHLGIVPADDAEGCLQDSHWAAGMVGYFPTYTLGNVFAAQLYEQARRDLGDLEEAFARGDFGGLLGWLREKVYRPGRRWSSAELVERATGAPPDPRPLLRRLRRRYGELYGI